jgi:hypothetical protein
MPVSPGISKNRRGYSEADNVGDGIKLHSKFGIGSGHAGDSTIEGIE